ncbi:cysteine desulfurase family protein [Faecalibaculum rodentium]|uniref:cysteine desulfurase family protein n=1 Tax=Faecalibaculum rodentium TaxID=1702221 RepID=UPI0023F51DB9|nr:cysteine desulfurase family protein [Faecalibaculum rodentium]
MTVYLDYSASAPISRPVLEKMIEVYQTQVGNPDSRTHEFGINSMKTVKESRQEVARLFEVDSQSIVFTSGATESNNLVIQGLGDLAESNNKMHIVSSSIEHKSILETLRHMEKQGFEVTFIDPDENGRINPDAFLRAVREDTLLGILMHVNNETGIIQPVEQVGKALKEKGVLFLVDATQSVGKLVPELKQLEYDFLTFSAHKLQGPQGIGALVEKTPNLIKPIMFGGNQQRKLRPGTIPVALVAGLGEACSQAEQTWKKNKANIEKLYKAAMAVLKASGVRHQLNGEPTYSLKNLINISFDDVSSEALMIMMKGICAISNGSACNSDEYSLSYVLENMHLDEERMTNAVRISWGPETDEKDLKMVMKTMCEAAMDFQ